MLSEIVHVSNALHQTYGTTWVMKVRMSFKCINAAAGRPNQCCKLPSVPKADAAILQWHISVRIGCSLTEIVELQTVMQNAAQYTQVGDEGITLEQSEVLDVERIVRQVDGYAHPIVELSPGLLIA